MKYGVVIRTMGEASQTETVLRCARAAEAANLDDLWVVDHIAIPPDDAEGSNGRYLDPLATLAFLAAATARIGLGTSVLVLPYRPALPTAKWLATVQELSGGRLLLGVGAGWMEAEFRALGIDRRRRGALTDATLDTLHRCFGADDNVVEEHGQPFLFRPAPPQPPIFIGGSGRHCLERVIRYGDGWIPMGADPERLAEPIARLRELAASAGRPTPEVIALGGVHGDDPERGAQALHNLAAIGVTRFVQGLRYADSDEFLRGLDSFQRVREAAQN
ncbi:MAG: TIGR03619 family F420-dependent LLM class oxidoreductase [Myxococcota bacterium]